MIKKNPVILIIEDDRYITEYLEVVLSDRSYKIIQCDKGKKGYELSLKEQPDLVLLDLMLPDINGHEVIVNLKADTRTMSIPIIIISALSQKEIIQKCYNQGVVDYIVKPFDLQELLIKIEKNLLQSDKISLKKMSNKIIFELNGRISDLEINKVKSLIQHFLTQKITGIVVDLSAVTHLEENINLVLLSAESKVKYLKEKITFCCPKNNTKVYSILGDHFKKENMIFETVGEAARV